MKRLYILLFALLGCTLAIARNNNNDLIKANYLYRHLAFHEAIAYYEKVADQLNDVNVYGQLGDCYMLTKNPQQAITWYAKAAKINGCPPDIKMHYAQALMTLQQYDQALPLLRDYQSAKPQEKRVANLIRSCETASGVLKEIPGGSAVFQSFNTDGSDFGPVLKNNMLVFTSDTVIGAPKKIDEWTGTAYYNMYSVSCDMQGRCSNDLKKLATNINTKFHDGPASFTADGKEMYFTRTNYMRKFLQNGSLPDQEGTVRLQIMVASDYDAATGQYKKIKAFPYNKKEYSTAHPTISPSGNTLVFASDMPGGEGGTDLYICKKDSRGNWASPVNAGKMLNTEGGEMFPFLLDDKTLYFSSDGQVGLGGLDVYKTSWNERTNSFDVPQHMGTPVNSSYDDMSLVLYADASGGYFASNRPAEKKGDNIYFLNDQHIYLSVKLLDAITRKPVVAGNVVLESISDKRSLTTDQQGRLLTQIFPQSQYGVVINKPGYDPKKLDVSTFNITGNDTIEKEILMDGNFAIMYNAVVLDEKTGQPIEDPMVVFSKIGGARTDSATLATGAAFTSVLQSDAEYHVYPVKTNYYGSEKIVSTKGITRGIGKTEVADTLYMKKLQVGEVYKIENIYYDYDKTNIREDAKPSLNRLLELLNQYPQMRIQVNSHTDCRGSDAYNMRLSQGRANSVIKYLQERGVSRSRLEYKGYGETMPVEKCEQCEKCTEEQHQKNRRTEFQIVTM